MSFELPACSRCSLGGEAAKSREPSVIGETRFALSRTAPMPALRREALVETSCSSGAPPFPVSALSRLGGVRCSRLRDRLRELLSDFVLALLGDFVVAW